MQLFSFLSYRVLILFTVIHSSINGACASSSKFRDEEFDSTPLYAHRLSTDFEHTKFLIDTLNSAKNTVMISSYSVSLQRLESEGIDNAIINAAARGVEVYVYYEHRLFYPQKEYASLSLIESSCAKFEENTIHAKCVIKDKNLVAIGSYNWLSGTRKDSINGTMVTSGLLASGLISDVWQGIRFYQSLKYENNRGIKRFLKDRDAFSKGSYEFAPQQFFYTLRTPEAHHLLLDEVLEKAKQRILLFSPFIRSFKLENTLTPQLLLDLHQKGVKLTLITLSNPCDKVPGEERRIFDFLNQLKHSHDNFSYEKHQSLHAKTLIADEDVICEGSYNWLSAVTDIDHEANNFEMSTAVRGDIARSLIQSFFGTAFGSSFIEEKSSNNKRPIIEKEQESLTSFKKARSSSSSTQKLDLLASQHHSDTTQPFKIFSGEGFNKQGYCVKYNNGDYLRYSSNKIIYFETIEIATQAAYDYWRIT